MRLINFQCFKDSGDIPINRMTIFIGENDSGKTCLLKALNIFFSDKLLINQDMFHELNNHRETVCSITLIFKTNPVEDIPRVYIVNDQLTIKKEFNLDENGEIKSDTFVVQWVFEDKDLNSIPDLKMPQLKALCDRYNFEYNNVDDAKDKLYKYTKSNFSTLPKNNGYCNIRWSEISPYLPIFEYYNSSDYGNPRQYVETTLKNIYRSFFYDYDENGNETLKEELVIKRDEIRKELDKKIQENLRDKVRSRICKVRDIYGDYSIEFSTGFTLTNILVDYGDGPRSINSIGEGSKKRLLLAIVEWDKEIKSKEPHKVVIKGYDEPDASLHYSAQKEMYYTLKDLSNNSSAQVQVIICTHSISMIDRAPARLINHIKQESGVSHIEYLKDYDEKDIKEFLDNISEMAGIKNSSIFFERCFVIVEGDTEENALPAIYRKLVSKSLPEDGIILINLKGNGSWESFLKLLNRNKSEATILFLDNDTQEDTSRKITINKLRQINFDQDFLYNNVILVGNKEFEDTFSDTLICRCLNVYWPKMLGEHWESWEIKSLRSKGKFSGSIIDIVNRYIYDNDTKNSKRISKPEFGKKIAELANVDELKKIPEIAELTAKISTILNS